MWNNGSVLIQYKDWDSNPLPPENGQPQQPQHLQRDNPEAWVLNVSLRLKYQP